jgi:arylsulfatase A
MQLDADMGRLLESLATHNIDQETLLIFTSDNGCSPEARLQELQNAGHQPNHIYRGHKADAYEGGHRIPFIARWPGHIPANRVNHSLIGQIDLMATLAEITGQPLTAQTGEDSISFLPTLLDKPTDPDHPHTSGRDQLVSQSINGTFALRDGAWKLILGPGSGGWSRPQPGSREETDLPEFQLYDLETDPSEKINLSARHPERVASLKAAMESLVSRGRSTPGPDLANDVPVTVLKPLRPR